MNNLVKVHVLSEYLLLLSEFIRVVVMFAVSIILCQY